MKRRKLNEIPAAAAAVGVSSSSSGSAPPPSPPWIELPYDVTANILKRLGAEEILRSAQNVCVTWWKVCHDPAMWRVVHLKCRDINPKPQSEFDRMCRNAVDRSQGQLIDLSITRFCEPADFLDYIAHRSRNLWRLAIVYAFGSLRDKFESIFGKLSKLEELHLVGLSGVYAEDVARIGRSCPMLKSFTFIQDEYDYKSYKKHGAKSIRYGASIGKTMHNLRRLQLSSNWITNEQAEAILDGCPLLEALHFQLCFNLDLRGDLGKRYDPMVVRFFETL